MFNYCARVPNFTKFRSTITPFQIIEVYGFSILYNGEFDMEKIVKNRKLKMSKIPKVVL